MLTQPELHFDPKSGCPTFQFASLDQPTSHGTVAGDSGDDQRRAEAAKRAVLVVDDEDAIRQLIAKVLQRHDYQPVEATDGYEALEFVSRKTFHSIVLDLMMPVVSGFEVLRRLADGEQWTDAIVVVSAATEPVKDQLLRLPCVHAVLPKPFNIQELVRQVATCRATH